MSETRQCDECGMHTEANEYHPYAACLIFKQTSSSKAVHANLKAVLDEGGNRWRSVAEQAEKALAVAIVQLYDSHKDDCLAAFSLDQLQWASDASEPLRDKTVEAIYSEALAAFDSLRKEETGE